MASFSMFDRADLQGRIALLDDMREVLFPPEEAFATWEPIDYLGDALALWSKIWDEVKAS